jgi:hypothetical protein
MIALSFLIQLQHELSFCFYQVAVQVEKRMVMGGL